MILAEFGAL